MNLSKRLLACCALIALPLAAHAAEPAYKLVKTVPLGAPDRWDYLSFDGPSKRVYIAHGDRVTVVDSQSGAIIGDVLGMPGGTHGIAISHATNQGYTDDGKAGEVAVFDPATLKVTARIKAEPDADGIGLDPTTGHIFVMDGDSAKVTVIDPKTNKVIATIEGGGGLEAGVASTDGKFYIDGAEKRDMVVIDTKTNKVTAHWPMPECESPHGIDIDNAHHRLFASCANAKMAVLNTDTGKVIAMLAIDKGTDAAGFDVKHQNALSSNRVGTLSVIHEVTPDKYDVQEPVKTVFGGRTMTVDPQTGRVFIVSADITENKDVPASDYRKRYTTTPGSAKLFIYDPAN